MIRLRDLLTEANKPRKGDKVIEPMDKEEGIIHSVSGQVAYVSFPSIKGTFVPVPIKYLEKAGNRVWKEI